MGSDLVFIQQYTDLEPFSQCLKVSEAFFNKNCNFSIKKKLQVFQAAQGRKRAEITNIRSNHCSFPELPRGSPKYFPLPQISHNQESFATAMRVCHEKDIYGEKNPTQSTSLNPSPKCSLST